ncbi:MAG TPA: GNAT family N-acetyltransferase [Blastocatellia bacterium]|nr:GNAT family N-acetyltransferase [Blastocatellia bacterium]
MNRETRAPISLRPVCPDDEPFLYALYSSTRIDEISPFGWDETQQRSFFALQFKAQQQHWSTQFPDADHHIIVVGDRPAGRLLVNRTSAEIRLGDISLLPDDRNRGIGASLIRQLQAEAARDNLPLTLHVAKSNRAIRLYERLGFVTVGDIGSHFKMEWRADMDSGRAGEKLMLEKTTQQMFRDNLGTTFRTQSPSSGPVEMELISVVDHGSTPRQEQFSLIFLAPEDTPILQNLFVLEHGTLGTFDLLLVPIGRDATGIQFEAVINRFPTNAD